MQLHELVLFFLLKGHMVEMILDQLLELPSIELRFVLSLMHSDPPYIGLVFQIEHSKAHLLLLKALDGIKQLLHAPDPMLKGLRVRGAIING